MKNQVDVTIAATFFALGVAAVVIPAALFYFSFERVVFERPAIIVTPPADDADYECIRAEVESADFDLIRNDDNVVDDLVSGKILTCALGHEVEIKGFNLSRDVVYSLARDKFFRDPGNNHFGYRIHLGERSTPSQRLVIIYPLNSAGQAIQPLGNRYTVVTVDSVMDGPCPDMCN